MGWVRAGGFVLWVFASGCTTAAAPWCGPDTCGGCCRGAICEPGTATAACGVQGAACSECIGSGQTCGSDGACLGGGSGGGGGGSGGGGGGGVSCAAPLSACGGSCVDTRGDRDHCGNCTTVCAVGALCSAGKCETLPADCSVAACPAVGYYCDLSSKQCKSGCVLDAQCSGALNKCDTATRTCGCQSGSCGTNSYCSAQLTCVCSAGSHPCGPQCLSNASLDSCGTSCVACPAAPANAARVCDGTQCGFTCNPGFLRSGNDCVACTTVQACGSACVQCPVPANASAQCSGGCGFTCNSGFLKVGNGCVACTTVLACGASCQACPGAADSTPVCSGGTVCALSCVGPFKCGSGCCAPATLTAAYNFSCAATSTGAVRCWGNNSFGQLGIPASSSEGVTVVPGIATARRLGAASYTTCAELQTGEVKCWGYGSEGQLGNGAKVDSVTPVTVIGLSGVKELKGGFYSLCALTTGGGVKCWGNNFGGRLGNNSTMNASAPVDVIGLTSGAQSVAVGTDHACAVTAAGAAVCWGRNPQGQLGVSTSTSQALSPVTVLGLSSGVKAIATGDAHTCALLTTGAVKCWGSSSYGEIPGSTAVANPTPVDITGAGTGNLELVAAGAHTCAITANRGVKCWGRDGDSELGDGPGGGVGVVQVAGLTSGVLKLASGYAHVCALLDTGAIKCWGNGYYRQNGQPVANVPTELTVPTDIAPQP